VNLAESITKKFEADASSYSVTVLHVGSENGRHRPQLGTPSRPRSHCTSGPAARHSTRDCWWHRACLQCDRSPGRRHTSPWGRPAAALWEGAAQCRAGHHVLGERFGAPSWH